MEASLKQMEEKIHVIYKGNLIGVFSLEEFSYLKELEKPRHEILKKEEA